MGVTSPKESEAGGDSCKPWSDDDAITGHKDEISKGGLNFTRIQVPRSGRLTTHLSQISLALQTTSDTPVEHQTSSRSILSVQAPPDGERNQVQVAQSIDAKPSKERADKRRDSRIGADKAGKILQPKEVGHAIAKRELPEEVRKAIVHARKKGYPNTAGRYYATAEDAFNRETTNGLRVDWELRDCHSAGW